MVQLPRPSTAANSGSIDVFPSASRSQQLPPTSSIPCCYRFGQATLSPEAKELLNKQPYDITTQLLAVTQLLAIPSQFARGDGQAWTHSAQYYPSLLRWKEQQVPALLAQVAHLLQQLSTCDLDSNAHSHADSVHLVVGHVVCAVSRYLPPAPTGIASESDPTHQDGWISDVSTSNAKDIISSLQSSKVPQHATIAKALLADYIKPIFREAASSSSAPHSSIDPTTGRKKPPASGANFVSHLDANLGRHRFHSADEDGDASNLAPSRFTLTVSSDTLRSSPAATPVDEKYGLMQRNEALGCTNVLSWCLSNLQLDSESDWTEAWPLIVPPLLTLLEHPQPRFRVRGSLLALNLLSHPTTGEHSPDVAQRRSAVLGKILIRTGIGSLLERALHVNLTYIHDEVFAAPLLSHSIGALRRLILLTTHPVVFRSPIQSPVDPTGKEVGGWGLDPPHDCGGKRLEALTRLVSECVLSTWSYLPLPPSSTRLGRLLTDVTVTAFLGLIDDLAAPPLDDTPHAALGAVSRFTDVTFDWIFRSWLSNVAFLNTEEVGSTRRVLELAQRLLKGEENVARWTGMMLVGVARCWISALESPLRTDKREGRWEELKQSLIALLARLSQLDPSVAPRWARLVKVDPRLEGLSPQ